MSVSTTATSCLSLPLTHHVCLNHCHIMSVSITDTSCLSLPLTHHVCLYHCHFKSISTISVSASARHLISLFTATTSRWSLTLPLPICVCLCYQNFISISTTIPFDFILYHHLMVHLILPPPLPLHLSLLYGH